MILNCLIVDDDRTSRAVLSAMVGENSGLKLLGVAVNGKHALELTQKYDLDLVFLDVSMPVMGGFEFLDQVVHHKNFKIILVTTEKEYALKAFEYNITDFLLKPVSRHRFNQAVKWVMQTMNNHR